MSKNEFNPCGDCEWFKASQIELSAALVKNTTLQAENDRLRGDKKILSDELWQLSLRIEGYCMDELRARLQVLSQQALKGSE